MSKQGYPVKVLRRDNQVQHRHQRYRKAVAENRLRMELQDQKKRDKKSVDETEL